MKKRIIIVLAFVLAFTLASVPADAKKRRASEPEVKYVFYMIGDGMGINSVYGTRLYNRATGNGPENINFLQFPVRTMITTHSNTSLVTDSAAAGTALASGSKTDDYSVGVDSDKASLSSLADWAKALGYGTGVATSVGINHATPSCFYAHVPSRKMNDDIINDFIAGDLDFLAGGGIYYNEEKGPTADEYESMIKESGITVLRGDEMAAVRNVDGRLLCLAGEKRGDLKYAIDQSDGDTGLQDFVKAGIEYLDEHYGDKGFFFMVEGGKIDYANHSNDLVGAFHEVNDFAGAVELAMEFYNAHPDETLIVVTADHDTGGLSLGAGKYRIDADRLAWQKESEDALTRRFVETFSGKTLVYDEVKDFLSDNLGLWSHVKVNDAFEMKLAQIIETLNTSGHDSGVVNLYSVNSKPVYEGVIYLAETAGFKWSHSTHTGAPVGLFVMGPKAELFNSCLDNVDVPVKIAEIAGYRIF